MIEEFPTDTFLRDLNLIYFIIKVVSHKFDLLKSQLCLKVSKVKRLKLHGKILLSFKEIAPVVRFLKHCKEDRGVKTTVFIRKTLVIPI